MNILSKLVRHLSFILILVATFNYSNAQSSKGKKELFNITEVTLKDTALVDALYSYIARQTKNDTLFNRKGYIWLVVNYRPTPDRKVLSKCFFDKRFTNFDDDDARFPIFYTYINGRMVIIENSRLSTAIDLKISKKSKRHFRKLIEPFLFAKETDFLEGHKIMARFGEVMIIDGGNIFYKMEDGTSYSKQTDYTGD
ncbi:hypothetical protein ABIB40_003293 [Pedobacter sp. UYP30]|uniref:hypothetical protein n=1 Tax=Pedobacter sp. UYP30 TaxID=1756400 RepID=UPI003397A54E